MDGKTTEEFLKETIKNKNHARRELGRALSSIIMKGDSPETRGHVQKALDYLNGKAPS